MGIRNYTKFFLRWHFVFWALGVYFFGFYLLLVTNARYVINYLRRSDYFFSALVIFFFLQVLSVLVSPLNAYFDIWRFAAISHNLLVFLFLLCGYVLYHTPSIEYVKKNISNWLLLLTISSVAVFIYYYLTHSTIGYPGIVALLTGLRLNILLVEYNSVGYLFGLPFPRTQILGIFSNSTSMLIVIFYVLHLAYNEDAKMKRMIIHSLVILALITTGSRISISLGIITFPFILIDNRKGFFLIISVYLLLLFLVLNLNIIDFVNNARSSSNDLRGELYIESLKIALNENPLFGLGSKPRLKELFHGNYPIGSHSTLIGYFVKSGVIVGVMYLFFHIYVVFDFLHSLLRNMFNRYRTDFHSIRFKLMLNVLMATFLFDDLDAYEPIGLFTGIVIAVYIKEHSSIKLNRAMQYSSSS